MFEPYHFKTASYGPAREIILQKLRKTKKRGNQVISAMPLLKMSLNSISTILKSLQEKQEQQKINRAVARIASLEYRHF